VPQFWKQFFEASANVSLSGYEEPALEEEDETTQNETSTSLQTPTDHEEHTVTRAPLQEGEDDEEFSVDSPTQVTGVQATPKLAPPSASSSRRNMTSKDAFQSPSPRKYTGRNPLGKDETPVEPSTPRPNAALDPQSSPFEPESAYQPSAARPSARRHNSNDPLLHRGVLDKNYRVQATPHTQRRQRQQGVSVQATPATATKKHIWDESPDSSPEVAAPQLRSDLFSPIKGPRTPGISVLTPAARRTQAGKAPTTSTGRQLFSPQDKAYTASRENRSSHIFADDDSDDEGLDISPPKTMQFHVPQSRLMQTPAREASRKIVEDLLLTAGADATDDIEAEGEGLEEASPSVVRRAFDVEDDTF
jgi:DASH complex subunit ASK1